MNRIILITLITFCIACALHAQQSSDTIPSLPNDEVEVIKDFKARMANTRLISWGYTMPEFEKQDLTFDYDVKIRPIALEYPAPIIRPIALIQEPKVKEYHFFVEGMYGWPNAWQGNIIASNRFNNKWDLGAQYTTHGALLFGEQDFLPYQLHHGSLYSGYKFSDFLLLKVKGDYRFNQRDAIVSFGDSLPLTIHNSNVDVRIQNPTDEDLSFLYELGINYKNFAYKGETNENFVDFIAGIGYRWKFFQPTVNFQYYRTDNFIGDENSILHPSIQVKASKAKWRAEAGFDYVSDSDESFALPSGKIAFQWDNFIVAARASNDISIVNSHDLSQWNPFLFGIVGKLKPQIDQKYAADIIANLNWLTLEVTGGYRNIINAPSFEPISVFLPDGGSFIRYQNASGAFIDVMVEQKITEDLRWNGELNYFGHTDDGETILLDWYQLRADVEVQYTWNNLSVKPGLGFITGLKSHVSSENRSIIDAHFDAYYQLGNNAQLVLKGENLLNQENVRWSNKQSIGTTIMLGFNFKL